jgi:hypothetical protein
LENVKVETILGRPEFRTTNPNLQIHSEELAKKLEEKAQRYQMKAND